MTDTREKVLLDTDIGTDIDDAVALAYLLSQERCDLMGITTVTGEPQRRAEMASAMCRHVGRDDIPIHSGSAQGITFHDPLAAACIFEPDLCRYKQGHVRVLLHDPTAGWTVFRDQADGPHTVAAQVDAGRFFEHYFSVVK